MENAPFKELISVPEFLIYFGISRTTFYSELKKKKIKIKKVNRRTFILRTEATRWMNELEEG